MLGQVAGRSRAAPGKPALQDLALEYLASTGTLVESLARAARRVPEQQTRQRPYCHPFDVN
jgi:hypothetical protein